MRQKYQRFDLDAEYLKSIGELRTIRLAIVGRDPFPRGAVSIPFVKNTWDQIDKKSAGYHLFNSTLGPEFQAKGPSPRAAASALLRDGVVLLNASYYFLDRESISRKRHFCLVDQSLQTNYPVLEKAEHILLCGDAATMMKWVVEFTPDCCEEVPHPCPQSKSASKEQNKGKWDQWWSSGALKAWLQKRAQT